MKTTTNEAKATETATLETAKQMIREAGFTPSAASYVDEIRGVYAFSVESLPGAMGASAYTVQCVNGRTIVTG
jgi:hypothetical protein